MNNRSKEEQAADRIKRRAEYLADKPIDKAIGINKRKKILDFYFLSKSPPYDGSTAAPVFWEPHFVFINEFLVNSKHSHHQPELINLYYDKDTLHTIHPFTYCFYCFDDNRSSSAKLQTTPGNNKYPGDGSLGYLAILAINSSHRSRLGSFLIQVAIEQSIRIGLGGKLKLNSTQNSGQFYFKLGFLPEDDEIYKKLFNDQNTNGKEMYLPDTSIAVWKEKIIKQPIILTSQEISQLSKEINPSLAEQNLINKTYEQVLHLTKKYYEDHCNNNPNHPYYAPHKVIIFKKLIDALEHPHGTKYKKMENFAYLLRNEDKKIINQHRDIYKRYIANLFSIIFAIPALVRILHSYYRFGTCRFWQAESQKLQTLALSKCAQLGMTTTVKPFL